MPGNTFPKAPARPSRPSRAWARCSRASPKALKAAPARREPSGLQAKVWEDSHAHLIIHTHLLRRGRVQCLGVAHPVLVLLPAGFYRLLYAATVSGIADSRGDQGQKGKPARTDGGRLSSARTSNSCLSRPSWCSGRAWFGLRRAGRLCQTSQRHRPMARAPTPSRRRVGTVQGTQCSSIVMTAAIKAPVCRRPLE